MKRILVIIAILICASNVLASEGNGSPESGQVQISLPEYQALIEASRKTPKQAPAGYALGEGRVAVQVISDGSRSSAAVSVNLGIKVLENEWTLVPILPPGVALRSAAVSGREVELIRTDEGLHWGVKEAGSYQMILIYSVDAEKFENGYSLPLPLPKASALNFTATLPGKGLNVSVIPAVNVKSISAADTTTVTASIPDAHGVQLSWHQPAKDGYLISRAEYQGEVNDKACHFSAAFEVELLNSEALSIPLFSSNVTLSEILLDGKRIPLGIENGFFTAILQGKGAHKVQVQFEVPIRRAEGPPAINMPLLSIPISKVELSLPGKKEVSISSASSVAHRILNERTIATAFVPMGKELNLSWTEAVPEEIKLELRANASTYHSAYAEEGVLSLHAIIGYEITRGKTSQLELEVPKGVEINKISSTSGAIADWKLSKLEKESYDIVTVYLDRAVDSNIQLEISYDRALGAEGRDKLAIPLVRAHDVQRQRGMVALLSSKELTLKPLQEQNLTKVGENQLPPFVREQIKMTVAHTYKYAEGDPNLLVQATAPEKKQGKFDAAVHTLVSLSDVTMRGSAGVEVNVKSGGIEELQFELPVNVNVLSLTAPSLRIYNVNTKDGVQLVDVQFTQEMEGQFRIEVNYEYIMGDKEAETKVPTLLVRGAEVEQGKIAVEALSAVEVQASSAKAVSSLELSELPQQLILKTTNPILLAYKYVRTDNPFDLALKITRHREIEIQAAAIDTATYRTLITKDGIAVTAARFLVRNTRQQFLRVKLPIGSKVWATYVNGNAEKPAINDAGNAKETRPEILVKVINSSQGFPVEIIYQTPLSRLGYFGMASASLPQPDMIVTNTNWDLFLPDNFSYGRAISNMELSSGASFVSGEVMRNEVARFAADNSMQNILPLQISVPTRGVKFSFEKLYANQADEDPYVSIPYGSKLGAGFSQLLVVFGTTLIWIALAAFAGLLPKVGRKIAAILLVSGISLVTSMVVYLGVSYTASLATSLIIVALLVVSKQRNLRLATQ